MYWILSTESIVETDAWIKGQPEVIKKYDIHLGLGIRQRVDIPTIEIIMKKEHQGRLTDNLIAHGATGLVVNQKIKKILDDLEIDNIHYYPTTVINQVTNEIINDYQTGNIIGRIKCVNFDQSDLELDEDDGSIEFISKLVLKEKVLKNTDLKIFRMAEFFPIILAHDSVKNAMTNQQISGIRFYHPEEYVL
jgi:hypothetical protein